jgi:hypothetical protein
MVQAQFFEGREEFVVMLAAERAKYPITRSIRPAAGCNHQDQAGKKCMIDACDTFPLGCS